MPFAKRFPLILCFLVFFCATRFANCQEIRPVTLRSQIDQVQPMTGIVLWSDNEFASKWSTSISLEYRYCGYDECVDANGAFRFGKLESVLDDIASRNHQAVLRFYFCYPGKMTTVPDFIRNRSDYSETIGRSEGQRTAFCDWSNAALREFTLDFYRSFAAQFDQDPRIAFLQVGFGLWGEYHIYDGPRRIGKTFPDQEFQTTFLNHLHKTFRHLPWSISVDAADDQYSPIANNNELLRLAFGTFDDSFLCKQHAKENALNWRDLGLQRWQHSPAGGELNYYTRRDQRQALAISGPHGTSFEQAAKQFHISYMIGNDQANYQNRQRLESAGMATGYRFQVIAADTLRQEGRCDLRLKVRNQGVAPLYRDAFFAVGQRRCSSSLRGLLPGQSVVVTLQDVQESKISSLQIQCDAILPGQRIQFDANTGAR